MPLLTNGEAIRERRETKGLKIVEFARDIGYHPDYVSQIELGHENGGPEFHRKAAKSLGCEITDITSGTIPRRRAKKRAASA